MFSHLMLNAWAGGGLVALMAGAVGFFVVLRGSSFMAHALPQSAFAGAAGAALVGADPLLGLGVFSALAAGGLGLLQRRARRDVAAALCIVVMLALGSLFIAWSNQYSSEVYSLLFGMVLGVSGTELWPTLFITLAVGGALAAIFRPLLLSSVAPYSAEASGLSTTTMEGLFLVTLAAVTTAAVPVVGALLVFSLMVGPPAAARVMSQRPGVAMLLSVSLSLVVVWAALALSYESGWPVGFYVGVGGTLLYLLARSGRRLARHRGVATPRQPGG